MRSRRGTPEWKALLVDLETLQRKWDAKADLGEPGRALRAHGVAFGIETGRRRLGEGKTDSPAQLNALLIDWEGFGKLKASGSAAASIKGIDIGIRLVSGRVRRYLKRLVRQQPPALAPVRPKPPTSASNGKVRWYCSGKRHSRS